MMEWLKRILAWLFRRPGAAATRSTGRTRIERVVLAREVAYNLFDEFANHRQSDRGLEEIGWILMGYVQHGTAIAVAALPAGAERDAGAAHVWFNADAQELACRILRQYDRRLRIIGVVHTHPGSMRWPSEGDLAGDGAWVGRLRGEEGVFAIGTADARPSEKPSVNRDAVGPLCFSWYALGKDDQQYRELPYDVVDGPNLAVPLHRIWSLLEEYAPAVNTVCRSSPGVTFQIRNDDSNALLVMTIPVCENQVVCVLLSSAEVRYYWERGNVIVAIDVTKESLDLAVASIAKEISDRERTGSLTPAM